MRVPFSAFEIKSKSTGAPHGGDWSETWGATIARRLRCREKKWWTVETEAPCVGTWGGNRHVRGGEESLQHGFSELLGGGREISWSRWAFVGVGYDFMEK